MDGSTNVMPPVVVGKTESSKSKAKPEKREPRMLSFAGPIGEVPGYMCRRVDLFGMSKEQQANLYRLLSGLVREGSVLRNGTVVKSPMHALKWMLENMTAD